MKKFLKKKKMHYKSIGLVIREGGGGKFGLAIFNILLIVNEKILNFLSSAFLIRASLYYLYYA